MFSVSKPHESESGRKKRLVSELVIAGKNGGKLSPFIFLEEVQRHFQIFTTVRF